MKKIIYTLMLIGLASCSNKVESKTHEVLVIGKGIEFVLQVDSKSNANHAQIIRDARTILIQSGYPENELSNVKLKINKLN